MLEIMSWSVTVGTDENAPTCSCGCSCSCTCEEMPKRTVKATGVASGGASADAVFNSLANPTICNDSTL